MRLLQRGGEPGFIARFQDEMDMAWHQAERLTDHAKPLASATQAVEVIRVVLRLKKGLLATIAPLRHVMGIARQDETGSAGHARIVAAMPSICNLCERFGG